MLTIKSEQGQIQIDDEAIKRIVESSVGEIPGIAGMVNNTLKDGVNEILKRENYGKGIDVNTKEEGIYSVTLHVAIKFGTKIYEVVRNAQERIKYDLENLIGAAPENIDVHVRSVRIEEPEEKSQD